MIGGCGTELSSADRLDQSVGRTFVTASGYLQSSEVATIVVPIAYRLYNYKITFIAPEGVAIERGQPLVSFDASQGWLSSIENLNLKPFTDDFGVA